MSDSTPELLKRPFYASAAELEMYQRVVERWHTLSADEVLTEAARLFNFAVLIARDKP